MVTQKKARPSVRTAARSAPKLSRTAVTSVKKAAGSIRKKRGMNLSRKQILTLQRDKFYDKMSKRHEKEREAKQAATKLLSKASNKSAHRPFDHEELKTVHEGLVGALSALGESITPSSLLLCALTSLGKSPDTKHKPYLLVICGACLPKVTVGMVGKLAPQILRVCEECLSEAESRRNALLAAKSVKLLGQLFIAAKPTGSVWCGVRKLEPSKLQTDAMCTYVTALRKMLQFAALTGAVEFFAEALPQFANLCIGNLVDAAQDVVTTSIAELQTLFAKTLGPLQVESTVLQPVINDVISQLTQIFRPHTQRQWVAGADLVASLFQKLSYLKRTVNAAQFLSWFSNTPFLLKVLNKLHHIEDTVLNSRIEQALIAIGRGMTVEEFVSILPFNPADVDKIRASGQEEDTLWKNSYLVNVVRRIASHDSLPFFVRHFLPMIQLCQKKEDDCTAAGRVTEIAQWSALKLQYWRVCVGFFQYPRVITSDSYRDVAKALVALLSTPLADTAAHAFDVICKGYWQLSTATGRDEDEDEDELTDTIAPTTQPTQTQLEDDERFLRLNDPSWDPHAYHGITQRAAQEVCQGILAKFSVNIMPKLCNALRAHETTAMLDAIQSYSKVCAPSVMQTILKGVSDVGSNIVNGDQDVTSLTAQRRVILDIACAIVGQLEEPQLVSIFDTIVEPVLSDPSPSSRLLQKKAYKLLFSMFEQRIQSLMPLFGRISRLLAVGQQHVTVSGLKMRIRCVNWALDACKMYQPEQLGVAVEHALGEIVLFARERSAGARDMAMEVLEKMQRYMTGRGWAPNALLHKVLAGLSGKTGLLVSSTIVCLAKLIHMSAETLSHADITGTTKVVCRLLESSVPEIRTAASIFVRMMLKLMKRNVSVANAVRESLPQLLQAVALVTSQSRVSSSVRVEMRVLVEKCIKRFGFAVVNDNFPLGSKKFLLYANKMLRREEKKEEREQKKRNDAQRNEFDDMFLGNLQANSSAGDADDLLAGGGLTQFVAHRSALPFGQHAGDAEDGEDPEDDMCLVSENDKIRIVSKAQKAREDHARQRKLLAERLLRRAGGVLNPRQMATSDEGDARGRKRGRDTDAEAEDVQNDELVLRYGGMVDEDAVQRAATTYNRGRTEAVSSDRQRPTPSSVTMQLRDQKMAKKMMNRERAEEDIRKGDEFASTKGSGDVKRGKLDPFAYVPLNRRYMNKRHRRQAVERFEAVATKSPLHGNKAKMSNAGKPRR